MRSVFVIFLLFGFLEAGLFDFWGIKEAKESYQKGEYKKAAKLYGNLDKNSEVLYNLGNSLYKSGDYEGALESYKGISDEKLKFQKLHNLGNSYAKLKKIDEAIKSYEEALKIHRRDKGSLI